MKIKKGFPVSIKNVFYSPTSQPSLKILDGVNLEVSNSEFISIVGENGSGKSTLLRAIAGEIELTSGTIEVGGQFISNPIKKEIDGVGIIHQDIDEDLLLAYSVAMNVAFRQIINHCHPNLFWSTNRKFKTKISSLLAPYVQVDIDTLVSHLSGGQKQMLNLVIAIHLEHIDNPCGLILLDEHTSKLDPNQTADIMRFTYEQIRESNTTAIMVTHKLWEALTYSDKIYVMKNGKLSSPLDNLDKNISLEALQNML